MRKEFFINVVILIAINAAIKPIYLLIVETEVQNIVGASNWGNYFDLLSLVYLFQFINDPGFLQFNTVELALDSEKSQFSHILGLKTVLAFVFLIIIIIDGLLVPHVDLGILTMIAINFVLASFFILFRSSISAKGSYRTDSIISSLDKIILLSILAFIIWVSPYGQQFNITWFVTCQLIASLLALSIAFVILKKKVDRPKVLFSKQEFYSIIQKCYPYTILIFLMTAYTKMDAVMIRRLVEDGSNEVGIYAAGFRFFDAANMIGILAAGVLLPMYTRNLNQIKVLNKLIVSGLVALTAIIGSAVLILLLFSSPLLSYFYNEYTPYYDEVFFFIILALLPLIFIHVFGPILLATRRLANINKIFLVAVIINFVLNYVLIPSHEAKGAAIATLITQMFVAIAIIPIALIELRKHINSQV